MKQRAAISLTLDKDVLDSLSDVENKSGLINNILRAALIENDLQDQIEEQERILASLRAKQTRTKQLISNPPAGLKEEILDGKEVTSDDGVTSKTPLWKTLERLEKTGNVAFLKRIVDRVNVEYNTRYSIPQFKEMVAVARSQRK